MEELLYKSMAYFILLSKWCDLFFSKHTVGCTENVQPSSSTLHQYPTRKCDFFQNDLLKCFRDTFTWMKHSSKEWEMIFFLFIFINLSFIIFRMGITTKSLFLHRLNLTPSMILIHLFISIPILALWMRSYYC